MAGRADRDWTNSLTSKLLCDRHNSALSPLDDEAGNFFRTLQEIKNDLTENSISRRKELYLFSGEMIELWMLKVACGLGLSFASRNGIRLKTDHIFDLNAVETAFTNSRWQPDAGMYLSAKIGNTFASERKKYRSLF